MNLETKQAGTAVMQSLTRDQQFWLVREMFQGEGDPGNWRFFLLFPIPLRFTRVSHTAMKCECEG